MRLLRLRCLEVREQITIDSQSGIVRSTDRPHMQPICSPFLVLQTDNEPRVRDGYISAGTRGQARALKAQREGAICRNYVILSDRTCPPVPLRNLHGKEGVDGSSPSEGFRKRPAYRGSLLSVTTLASSWRTHFSPRALPDQRRGHPARAAQASRRSDPRSAPATDRRTLARTTASVHSRERAPPLTRARKSSLIDNEHIFSLSIRQAPRPTSVRPARSGACRVPGRGSPAHSAPIRRTRDPPSAVLGSRARHPRRAP
jgi:hypothetical protein